MIVGPPFKLAKPLLLLGLAAGAAAVAVWARRQLGEPSQTVPAGQTPLRRPTRIEPCPRPGHREAELEVPWGREVS